MGFEHGDCKSPRYVSYFGALGSCQEGLDFHGCCDFNSLAIKGYQCWSLCAQIYCSGNLFQLQTNDSKTSIRSIQSASLTSASECIIVFVKCLKCQ